MKHLIATGLLFLATIATGKPPTTPTIVGSGSISTPLDEFGAAFMPDGKTCYFTIKSPSTISTNVMVICESHLENGKWSEPTIAPFSGRYKDFSPSISPDGNKLFFVSNRPVNGKPTIDLWVVERNGNGWREPVNVGEPVNSPGWELGCSMTNDGTLFFSSTGATGNSDIYFSKWVDGKFEGPVRLDESVNSEASETEPFIAPDGSYLLFSSTGRPDAANDNYPRGDIYVSFFKEGKWTEARNLRGLNSPAEDAGASVSSDGTKIYFSSERNFISMPVTPKLEYNTLNKNLQGITNGLSNIYEISSTILNDL
jgi:Tol biopolymer transport system component